MNATASRRKVRVINGEHAGLETEVSYAPYLFAITASGGRNCYYERQDPPVQLDEVWWHHYAVQTKELG